MSMFDIRLMIDGYKRHEEFPENFLSRIGVGVSLARLEQEVPYHVEKAKAAIIPRISRTYRELLDEEARHLEDIAKSSREHGWDDYVARAESLLREIRKFREK